MGDAHYNTWGGKNNSWGNKNRKNKQSNSGNNQEPNKLFNIFIGGVVLFVLARAGLGWVGDTISNIFDAKDKVENVRELAKEVSDTKISSDGNGKNLLDTIIENKIEDIFEPEAEDIQNILEKISDMFNANSIDTKVSNVIFIDYEDANTENKYTKSILDELSKYNSTVTFAIVVNKHLTNEEAEEIGESIKTIMNDTIDKVPGSVFRSSMLSTITNIPEPDNMILAITFIEK